MPIYTSKKIEKDQIFEVDPQILLRLLEKKETPYKCLFFTSFLSTKT